MCGISRVKAPGTRCAKGSLGSEGKLTLAVRRKLRTATWVSAVGMLASFPVPEDCVFSKL